MSLRSDMRVLTDEALVEIHEKMQNQVAWHLREGFLTLTAKYAKTARAAERELRSRSKYYGRLKK